jgi:hypothetical protein
MRVQIDYFTLRSLFAAFVSNLATRSRQLALSCTRSRSRGGWADGAPHARTSNVKWCSGIGRERFWTVGAGGGIVLMMVCVVRCERGEGLVWVVRADGSVAGGRRCEERKVGV